MDSFKVTGNGPLNGNIHISGAKNAVLPIMAAALLTDEECVIENVPELKDVATMCNVMRVIGSQIKFENNTLTINSSTCNHFEAPYELVKTMRASIYVLGPLLAKYGICRVSLPGGCAWGPRPVDLHIKGIEELGADVEVTHGFIEAKCDRLKGKEIFFPITSVGATANILMASVLAEGQTILQNAAMEPEITSLCHFLNQMGADISGINSKTLVINGKEKLNGATFKTIPDRIEAGTYLVAGAITRGKIKVTNVDLKDIHPTLETLKEMGASISTGEDWAEVDCMENDLKPVNIVTNPHPSFPTDMQAQFTALLATVPGNSTVEENIYPDRFKHVSELQRLGANINLKEHVAKIKGSEKLSGAPVMASDLRASAALVLAGLVAEGTTEISRIYHIDRGYEKFEEKLSKVGAIIERVQNPMELG